MATSRRLVLRFPRKLVDKPIVSRLVKDFDLDFNILKASVTPGEEGLLIMELTGESRNYDKGIK
jgi:ABC-type methionine transport system ATPase subunit